MAVQQLSILAGLRRLALPVKDDLKKMPIMLEDLTENDWFRLMIRQGMEQGRAEGEQRLLRLQIQKPFEPISDWANDSLMSLSAPQIEALGERIFDAPSIDSLLKT